MSLLDCRSLLYQFGTVYGDDIFVPRFENVVPFNSQVQMEPNTPHDSIALALQIQTFMAGVEELTR